MKKKKKKISPRVIERLTKYLRCLENLDGSDYISSETLATKMGYTAAQVRKDLSNFGEFGVRGKGYHIKALYDDIEKILGVDTVHQIILVGVGRLGNALLAEPEFTKEKFKLMKTFDKSPEKVGSTIQGVEVADVSELESYLEENPDVETAIIAVPKMAAQEISNRLARAGIEAILNFAPVKLKPLRDVTIKNVDLYAKLQELNYWKNAKNK
ncbi:MAG: redox-sensing transcriptional repressor Rex [Fusobacteriota bacterium]